MLLWLPRSWFLSIIIYSLLVRSFGRHNLCLNLGAAVTSPIFISIGGMLAIPATVIIDWFIYGDKMTVYKIVGTVIVALGFLLVNIPLEFSCTKFRDQFL